MSEDDYLDDDYSDYEEEDESFYEDEFEAAEEPELEQLGTLGLTASLGTALAEKWMNLKAGVGRVLANPLGAATNAFKKTMAATPLGRGGKAFAALFSLGVKAAKGRALRRRR